MTTQFYTYNDVAIFPAKTLDLYPKFFESVLQQLQTKPDDDDFIMFVCVTTRELLTETTFDEGKFHGYAIAQASISKLVYLEGNDKIKTKILDVLVSTSNRPLTLVFANNPEPKVASFYVNYGFMNPVYNQYTKTIELTYKRRVPVKLTLQQLEKLAVYDGAHPTIKIFLDNTVTQYLSKAVLEMVEYGGLFSLTKYTDDGVAVLGINSHNIKKGHTEGLELALNKPFAFHSHPNIMLYKTEKFGDAPSALDISAITNATLRNFNQIAHFVTATEGLWIYNLTVAFQELLISLRTSEYMDKIVNAVIGVYDNPVFVLKEIEPINREKYTRNMTSMLEARTTQHLQIFDETLKDVLGEKPIQLVNVKYISWKKIASTNGIQLSFQYVQDDASGLTSYIEPYNQGRKRKISEVSN